MVETRVVANDSRQSIGCDSEYIKGEDQRDSGTQLLVEERDFATKTSTFHPFPRLPIEIRSMIWRLAITPRVVDLWAIRHHFPDIQKVNGCSASYDLPLRPCSHDMVERVFTSPSTQPNVFEVCKESRSWGFQNGLTTLNADIHLPDDVSTWEMQNITGKAWGERRLGQFEGAKLFEARKSEGREQSILDPQNDIILVQREEWSSHGKIGGNYQWERTHSGTGSEQAWFEFPIMLSRLPPAIYTGIRFLAIHHCSAKLWKRKHVQVFVQMSSLKEILIYDVLDADWMFKAGIPRFPNRWYNKVEGWFDQLRKDNPGWQAQVKYLSREDWKGLRRQLR
jgi:hypothetical protein